MKIEPRAVSSVQRITGRAFRISSHLDWQIDNGFFNKPIMTHPPEMKWFIGVKVEQKTSARPPKKNPGSAPECSCRLVKGIIFCISITKLSPLKNLSLGFIP